MTLHVNKQTWELNSYIKGNSTVYLFWQNKYKTVLQLIILGLNKRQQQKSLHYWFKLKIILLGVEAKK